MPQTAKNIRTFSLSSKIRRSYIKEKRLYPGLLSGCSWATWAQVLTLRMGGITHLIDHEQSLFRSKVSGDSREIKKAARSIH